MLPILFENEDLVAVDKPEGLATIPEGRPERVCLLTLLQPSFPERLYIVHRLDKEASGVVLLAKNAAAHRFLCRQFESKQVIKTYLALVHGIMPENAGRIDQPIRQFGSGRMGVDRQRGKASLTEFTVLERLKAYTLIKVHPITGRRHQIRVHLYSLGHPIVGDLRYGDVQVQRTFPRLMLHALEVTCQLPGGYRVTITAPTPASFQAVVAGLNNH